MYFAYTIMSCLKKVKCWHILIPAIILLEIALACVYLLRKVQNSSIINDRTSQYVILAVFCVGLLLLVLIVAIIFGCHNSKGSTLSKLGSRFSRRKRNSRNYYSYRIQNMMYPFDESTIRPSKPTKKRKVKKGGLFFSRSKPFAVSSESFQYEHGSQYGDNSYRNHSSKGVSTLKRASIGTDTHFGVNRIDLSPMQSTTLRSKSGRKYLDTLSDSQFRFLYGSPRESFNESCNSSINPSYSDNLEGYDNHDTDRPKMVANGVRENVRVYSNPPILVSSGPIVRHNAPEATNLHMIYTDDDYAKICQREHKIVPYEQFLRNEKRSNPYQEKLPTERKIYRYGDYPRTINYSATGSYATDVQFINSSGKLVSHRVIRPKVTGAPVSVMVD